MGRALFSFGAALLLATASSGSVAAGEGRAFANGAFQATGAGGYNVSVGTAAGAAPVPIAAAERFQSVLIFGYAGGPSEGRTYCGDVWNVIVTVAFGFPDEKPLFAGLGARHYLDGQLVGANEKTAIQANQGFLGQRGWVQSYGTFLAPGTLSDGAHEVRQVLEHDDLGVLWAPPPLVFDVDDSAC